MRSAPNGEAENSSEDSESRYEDDLDGEEDEQSIVKPNPYNILLQSLQQEAEQAEPRKKKRKLDRLDRPNSAAIETSALDDADENPLKEANGQEEDTTDGAPVEETLDEDEDSSDPFETHFGSFDENRVFECIQNIDQNSWRVEKHQNTVDRIFLSMPSSAKSTNTHYYQNKSKSPENLKLKKRLAAAAQSIIPSFDELQRELVPYVFNYSDLLFTSRTAQNAASLRYITCLHVLNHVFKTRDRVLKNNAKLANASDGDELELRDQGFTRPRVLLLLETRQSCAEMIETMMRLCEPEQQENKKRFQDGYTNNEDKFAEDRPEDFRELFEGNDDNDFRLGLKFTRKTVRYFSPFYTSDIILASPLGLRRIVENDDPKKRDHDFLSSIEVVIVDQADAMLQQNWEHVEYVFSHLNLQPREAHGCDFSRVRNWYLDGHARFWRQTIIFSAYNTPELNNLFNSSLLNFSGKAKVQPEYDGSYLSVNLPLKQTFSRMNPASPAADPDARFNYFTSAIIPSLTRHLQPADPTIGGPGILIFIPSYLDFVRLRNYFASSNATQNISFGSVSEYTDMPEVRRARAHFFNGRHAVLLYTGRAHHFRRYKIRGVKKVVFYGLPDNPIFYREIIEGFLGQTIAEGRVDAAEVGARVMFSKWDALKLERIVGTRRVGGMLRDKEGDTFDFIS
ncbi:nucleolus protein required for cell viability [Viridothelium virens]|uniref:U3 small nucleolar RNA-associated protein 25 n=1 Tax=Viridothelium virens TaxID=1048519 RepID=A0A6A6H0Z8_VIRVR|nr:nucleolus protein required for cell viability [Viridothelium virens]